MKVRVADSRSVSLRTGKPVKGTLSTSVTDHILDCDHLVAREDFSINGRESNTNYWKQKNAISLNETNPP